MTDKEKQEEALRLKQQGNVALSGGQVDEAINLYTQALALLPDNAAIYSNRSAAYCQQNSFLKALADAQKALQCEPRWIKAYIRKGQALAGLGHHEQAMMAYFDALQIDPCNEQLKKVIRESKANLGKGVGSAHGILNPFGDRDLWQRLQGHPQTQQWLTEPDYKDMVERLHADPQQLGTCLQDARIMATVGILLGVDLNLPVAEQQQQQDVEAQHTEAQLAEAQHTEAQHSTVSEGAQKVDYPGEPHQALKEKEQGNAAYKKRDFETALQHYEKATQLDPGNITFRTNKAAVYFEQGEYDRSVQECQAAVEIGREHRADYKLIAKAFARMGNAHAKKGNFAEALTAYNKSLSEHRDPEIVKKVQQVQKELKEKERLAYINPEVSLEEKKKGNECFQKGDYPTAIKYYTEAIRRNPEDAKLYSNRAACYTKLAEFSMALKDCEECIKLDPKFVKGYLRKGGTLLALKESAKAAEAYQKALDLDPQCQEAVDGYRRSAMQSNDPESVKKRAMQDPEVQQILGDPAMQLILQQMQKDPKALHEHLQNPEVAKKIEKLMDVGLIAFK